MDAIKLSILTPAIPKRMLQVAELCESVQAQVGTLPVEHLVFIDNRKRTIGEKRDALLRIAKGHYVAFVDDDDEILPGYVSELVKAAQANPDVITFKQESVIDGLKGWINFGLGNPNEAFSPGATARRNAWHVCAWRRSLALLSHFPAINYGEDWAFASRLCGIANLKEIHIDKVLHRYTHSAATTEAPAPH